MNDDITRAISKWTVKALTRQCLAELDDSYDLVYVDYGDRFTDDQVAMIVRDDWEALWDSTSEWEGDQQYQSAVEAAETLARDIAQRWERAFGVDSDELHDEWVASTPASDAVRDAIMERDSSTWVDDLARNTPRVLMRHVLRDEDHSIYGGAWPNLTPTDVIKWLREGAEDGTVLKRNQHNVKVVRSVLNEAFHTRAHLMGMLVYAIDVADLIKLPTYTEHVDIVDPHLYLGNYYQGDGYCEGPLKATIRVKREDMRTDKDAPGWGWNEVAGVYTAPYEAEIIAVTPNPTFGKIEGATFYGGFEHNSVSTRGIESLGTYELWADGRTLIIRTSTGETERHTVPEVKAGLKGKAPWPLPWRVLLDRFERYTNG